jgi:hypothetical protein
MKMLLLTFAGIVAGTIVMADAVSFDNLTTGAPPPGWTATKTGTGEPEMDR